MILRKYELILTDLDTDEESIDSRYFTAWGAKRALDDGRAILASWGERGWRNHGMAVTIRNRRLTA